MNLIFTAKDWRNELGYKLKVKSDSKENYVPMTRQVEYAVSYGNGCIDFERDFITK